ncbi:transmembrane protein, putative (macronuclear) [Tetrahymena thermophila SB210]|uniref:Transmembrane protein, putative n=1 Tax=Tetrahymena thermophila (strain SB210) TaxID=312017 RepID=I7M4J6_TETTS|nr:transmembrane protein, putative [Tetrahymena thermophila SB210]EAS07183.1 transmembrane protein, putative [Tetrahymena thermophila SB210]|eukprot:XP_001027425.1 transmembrane protein, putative [Tetrahymena thermophila SB210]
MRQKCIFILALCLIIPSLTKGQTTLIEDQYYTDCVLSMDANYNNQLWVKIDKTTQSPVSFMNCINICQNNPPDVLYLLGLFDKSTKIKRKIEIFQKHSQLQFNIKLMQIDRWNVGEQFNIYVDGKNAATWTFTQPSNQDFCGMKGTLPIQQDTQVNLSFSVPHITNIVEVIIDTTMIGNGQWGLQSFVMSSSTCVSGDCLNMQALTFDLQAFDRYDLPDNQRFQVVLSFNQPFVFSQGTFASNTNFSIWEIDSSGYSTNVQQLNTTSYVIYLNLQTTIRENYFNLTFITPQYVRAVSTYDTIVNTYNASVLLPTYFYYSPSTISSSQNIAFAVWILGIVLTISLIPLILYKQFEVVAYTYYVHQMIYYYSFSQIRMPYNIVQFFESFKVYNFDFLPNIFKLAIDQNTTYGYVYQFKTDSLFLKNAGYLYTLFIIFLIVYFIVKLFSMEKFMKIKRIQTVMKSILQNVFEWNLFLEYSLLCFMHLLFAIFLQFFDLQFGYPVCYFSFLLCLISIILIVIQLIYLVKFIYKNKQKILEEDAKIETQFGVLWQSLKKDSFYFQTCFNMLLIFRRLIFIAIATFLSSFVYVQYELYNICNCCIMFLVAIYKPYVQQRNNFKVFISELQLVIIQAMIQNFGKDEGNDEDSRVKLGWFMISQILLLITMHYVFVGYEIARYAKFWFIKQISDAEEEFKQKIEKAAEEQKKLLGQENNENNQEKNIINGISFAVEDNLNHRRRRKSSRSSNFIEILSNSNKNIGENEKANKSQSQINDIQTIKSEFQDNLSRQRQREPSIVVFSKIANEDQHIQPILKKPTFQKKVTLNNNEAVNQIQDQSHDNKISQPNLNESKEEDGIQQRNKINPGNTDDKHMRHNRRKRNNTYISQVSVKSRKSIQGFEDISMVQLQPEVQNEKEEYANLRRFKAQSVQQMQLRYSEQISGQPTSQTNINTHNRKRHRTNSKVFQEVGVEQQHSSRTIVINPKEGKDSSIVKQPEKLSKTEKTEEQLSSQENVKQKLKKKKTKGVRVDSSQFQNIFSQLDSDK